MKCPKCENKKEFGVVVRESVWVYKDITVCEEGINYNVHIEDGPETEKVEVLSDGRCDCNVCRYSGEFQEFNDGDSPFDVIDPKKDTEWDTPVVVPPFRYHDLAAVAEESFKHKLTLEEAADAHHYLGRYWNEDEGLNWNTIRDALDHVINADAEDKEKK